jgi:hypothetical protein
MHPRGFIAYSSEPRDLGQGVESALKKLHSEAANLTPWSELPIAGRFVATEVRKRISESDYLVADITTLNFNVAYEIGFAIGKRKGLLLVCHSAYASGLNIEEFGIFDSLGYHQYENSDELANLLRSQSPGVPIESALSQLNNKAPVYLLEAKHKTDSVVRITSRVKKARLYFRSFDPSEHSRLSSFEAIRQVSQSYGVLVHLIPSSISDHSLHNLRAAFLAGLAEGMGKVLLVLQNGESPVPVDYRDLVTAFFHPEQIDEAIADFATRVTEALQSDATVLLHEPETLLSRLTLGASSAENELRDLRSYYLEIDAFQRAKRGEVRLVVGRKGSGKTALFLQLRDHLRNNRRNVVLDLKPEGYKLRKFKEDVLGLLEGGTLEHTITAFWEYLLLLEICHKLIEKDRIPHTRDSKLYEPYRQLADVYAADEFVSEGDFSERMSLLMDRIRNDFRFKFGNEKRLTRAEITELLYRHDVAALRTAVERYIRFKDALWLLFDNIDKGWPTHGLMPEDLVVIRTLIEATRKIEQHLMRRDVEAHTLVFLRNDVYELLIDETPDRGKETRVLLDWTDPDLLRELVRRRLIFNHLPEEGSFEELWRQVCVSHIGGEESSQYLIERSLLRPRALLDLISHCRSFAVNLGHQRIEKEDIEKGLKAYSTDLLYEISLEIRDVLPKAEDILYCFIDSGSTMNAFDLRKSLNLADLNEEQIETVTDILLWFGVLGVIRRPGEANFIYDVNYDMRLLRGIIRALGLDRVSYYINPAFWPALGIHPHE